MDLASPTVSTQQPEAKADIGLLASPITALNPQETRCRLPRSIRFVNQVYQNLFNRQAETAGLSYWQNQILTGKISIGTAVLTIANAAAGDDATTMTQQDHGRHLFHTVVRWRTNLGTGNSTDPLLHARRESPRLRR